MTRKELIFLNLTGVSIAAGCALFNEDNRHITVSLAVFFLLAAVFHYLCYLKAINEAKSKQKELYKPDAFQAKLWAIKYDADLKLTMESGNEIACYRLIELSAKIGRYSAEMPFLIHRELEKELIDNGYSVLHIKNEKDKNLGVPFSRVYWTYKIKKHG